VGALRRPELREDVDPSNRRAETGARAPESRYPRWAVVSGVVVYCAVFWVIVWGVANGVLDMVAAAAKSR